MANPNIETPQTIVIFWDGPYSIAEVKALDRSKPNNGNGFYLIVGTRKYRKTKALDYCGITTLSFGTRIYEHEQTGRFDKFKGEVEIWLGNCEQPETPDAATLRRAEKMLIVGWNVEGNVQGKASFPAPTCLVMRWYFAANGNPRKRRPDFARALPDVLWFEDQTWWTGQLRVQFEAQDA